MTYTVDRRLLLAPWPFSTTLKWIPSSMGIDWNGAPKPYTLMHPPYHVMGQPNNHVQPSARITAYRL